VTRPLLGGEVLGADLVEELPELLDLGLLLVLVEEHAGLVEDGLLRVDGYGLGIAGSQSQCVRWP